MNQWPSSGRQVVWNPRRGCHLGQRSRATATTGRTYDRKRSVTFICSTPCKRRPSTYDSIFCASIIRSPAMLHLAALKLDFAPALNHAVRRASVPVSVIRPVPRCAPLCFVGSGNADKRLFMKDNRSDNGQARLAKIFLFPVIGTITGAAGPFRRDHDSFVTRRSGCRHRANRIAKRASASGKFAAT